MAWLSATRRCLTFELRGRNWEDAWPARRMMTLAGARAKRLAGGGPWLERRVRRHWHLARTSASLLTSTPLQK